METLKTENTCRVCLEDQEELFSLISGRFECGDLCKIIQDVSGVVIDKTETKLPLKICQNCVESASIAQKFRNKCIESDQYLNGILQKEFLDIKEEPNFVEIFEDNPEVIFGNLEEHEELEQLEKPKRKRTRIKDPPDPDDTTYSSLKSGLVIHKRDQESSAGPGRKKRQKSREKFPGIHECSICKITLKGRSGLVAHERSHLRDKEFGKSAGPGIRRRKRSQPKTKDERVKEEIIHQCSACGQIYRTLFLLKTHERKKHSEKREAKFCCDHCGKLFSEKNYISRHMETQHFTVLRFRCHLCGKYFGVKENLKVHIAGHLGQRKFQCHLCPKAFLRKHSLQAHVRVHTGEKPYKCEYCDKAYSHHTDRMRHMISHTGKYPYNCKICSKGFERPSKLEAHVKMHQNFVAPAR